MKPLINAGPRFVALLLGSLTLLAVACGGGAPQELEINVKLEDGKLTPETIRVGQGDMVTLKEEGEVDVGFLEVRPK